MKTLMKLTLSGLFAMGLSSCVLLEGYDYFQSPGTVPVAEVGKGIFSQAAAAYVMAENMNLNSKFPGASGAGFIDGEPAGNPGNASYGNEYERLGTMVHVGRSAVNKQNWSGYYFQQSSVDKCYKHVFNSVLGMSLFWFDSNSTRARDGGDKVIDPIVATSRASCDDVLERTGMIVNLGEFGI